MPKRPRVETGSNGGGVCALGEAHATMVAAGDVAASLYPALWSGLREFRGELGGDAGGFGGERSYLRSCECAVYLRAIRTTVASTLYDANCRADKMGSRGATGWEAHDVAAADLCQQEDRQALGRRLDAVDAVAAAHAAWTAARLAATEPRPRLFRLARRYGFAAGGKDDRILRTLVATATAQTDAARCALIEDDHARRANLLCRLAGASDRDTNKRRRARPADDISSKPRIERGTVRSARSLLRSKISRPLGPIFFFLRSVHPTDHMV